MAVFYFEKETKRLPKEPQSNHKPQTGRSKQSEKGRVYMSKPLKIP